METGKVEQVLRYFWPNAVLKWTKDRGFLIWKNIWKYFEDFLKLNPRWKIEWYTIFQKGDIIIVAWDYSFELDSENWRITKPAQFLFVLKRYRWGKYSGKWWIKLLHSSFK